VVSTQVYEGLQGVPMLLVQPLAKDGAEKGAPVVCATARAWRGPATGLLRRRPRGGHDLESLVRPVDHAIVGIVDGVEAPNWKGGPA
jgi:microcompartment protein CcmK/EutM